MKASAILVVAATAALAAAQGTSYPQGFPQCGITCMNNMLGQASQLGCGDTAPSCLCTKQNFIYGVRDCATESCQDQSAAQQVIQYGSQFCASVGVEVSGIPTATGQNPSASTTVIATASPTNNPGESQGSSSQGTDSQKATPTVVVITDSTGGVSSSTSYPSGFTVTVPTATETYETTITNSEGTFTSAVTSVASVISVVSSGIVTGAESGSVTTGVIESTVTTNGSTLATSITTTGPASSDTSATEQPTESASESSGEAESSSTSNPAAQRTAAPVGFIAAAGLAALML
ncbi:hypothetical protein F5Y04DRAFT_187057 [Hypomontagnella monticulosa]|nr:hypothetical protein F5Y04DRAFT_187057 [Hypomontagnella monticulosa]